MFVLARVFEPFHQWVRTGFYYAIAFSFFFVACEDQDRAAERVKESILSPRASLLVATSGDYEPFSQWAANQAEPRGFSAEVARSYAADRGVDLHWIRFRWRELAADLDAGAFDIALSGITVRPDRSAKGRFSLPLTTSGAIVLVREDSSLEDPSSLDQPTIRLAVNAGGHLERVARRLFPSATIRPIADNANVLGELTSNRVDAVMTDSLEAPHWQRTTGDQLRAIGPLTRDQKAAWFPPERSDEAERFNRWLLRAESTGQLARLRAQFELPANRVASALPALLSSLDERLSLMNAVADAKSILGVATENAQREEVVLKAASLGILEAAKDAGVEAPKVARIHRFFRAQIEAAKWIQDRRRVARRATSDQPLVETRDEARTQLEKVIRPALIYLGDRISMLLVASVEDAGHSPSTSNPSTSSGSSSSPSRLTFVDVSDALARHDLPDTHLREIYEALAMIIRSDI